MEYIVVTPIEKAAMAAAVSKSNQVIPWLLIIAALIAAGILVALAIHEYEKSNIHSVQESALPQR